MSKCLCCQTALSQLPCQSPTFVQDATPLPGPDTLIEQGDRRCRQGSELTAPPRSPGLGSVIVDQSSQPISASFFVPSGLGQKYAIGRSGEPEPFPIGSGAATRNTRGGSLSSWARHSTIKMPLGSQCLRWPGASPATPLTNGISQAIVSAPTARTFRSANSTVTFSSIPGWLRS